MYLIRLDDASDYMDVAKWQRVEDILDNYNAKPLVGLIPENHDPKFVGKYPCDSNFWEKAKAWEAKGWTLALHGWHHVYTTSSIGINHAGTKSEFAGVPLDDQRTMIRDGMAILNSHGIAPTVFFAPSHTFDMNTLEALRRESSIRIISDTVANGIYERWGFHFVPVQISSPRSTPFKVTTICLHPNSMDEAAFTLLDRFLSSRSGAVGDFSNLELSGRHFGFLDRATQGLYRVNHWKNKFISRLRS